MSYFWSDEQDEALRKMWAAGAHLSEIAAEVGRTRSATAGRMCRLGLQRRTKQVLVRAPRINATKKIVIKRYADIPAPVFKEPTMAEIKTSDGVAFLDLRDNHCRWIFDDNTYCGHDVVGRSYCRQHFSVVYVTPESRGKEGKDVATRDSEAGEPIEARRPQEKEEKQRRTAAQRWAFRLYTPVAVRGDRSAAG